MPPSDLTVSIAFSYEAPATSNTSKWHLQLYCDNNAHQFTNITEVFTPMQPQIITHNRIISEFSL